MKIVELRDCTFRASRVALDFAISRVINRGRMIALYTFNCEK